MLLFLQILGTQNLEFPVHHNDVLRIISFYDNNKDKDIFNKYNNAKSKAINNLTNKGYNNEEAEVIYIESLIKTLDKDFLKSILE